MTSNGCEAWLGFVRTQRNRQHRNPHRSWSLMRSFPALERKLHGLVSYCVGLLHRVFSGLPFHSCFAWGYPQYSDRLWGDALRIQHPLHAELYPASEKPRTNLSASASQYSHNFCTSSYPAPDQQFSLDAQFLHELCQGTFCKVLNKAQKRYLQLNLP